MNQHHWTTGFTWWSVIAVAIATLAYWVAIRAKSVDRAGYAIPLACLVGFLGPMPAAVWAEGYWDVIGVTLVAIPAVSFATGPLWIVLRRQTKARRAYEKFRRDQVEEFIRRLGA